MSRVLGIDAGFTAMGVVVVEGRKVLYAHAFRTERTSKKRGVRVADDDTERCRHLANFLHTTVTAFEVKGAVVEMPHGGAQGARASRAMGMATGVVAAALELLCLPFECVTPGDVKQAATGDRSASKKDVQVAVEQQFDWDGQLPDVQVEKEHICDAAGALLAASNGTLMRALQAVGA